jgi:hypothetical protein
MSVLDEDDSEEEALARKPQTAARGRQHQGKKSDPASAVASSRMSVLDEDDSDEVDELL